MFTSVAAFRHLSHSCISFLVCEACLELFKRNDSPKETFVSPEQYVLTGAVTAAGCVQLGASDAPDA